MFWREGEVLCALVSGGSPDDLAGMLHLVGGGTLTAEEFDVLKRHHWKTLLFRARSKAGKPPSEDATQSGKRPEQVWQPIDFEGPDTSLTQAELALLK